MKFVYSLMLSLLLTACAFAGKPPNHVPLFDTTVLTEIPPDFYDRGMTKAPVIYEREFWPPGGTPNFTWADAAYISELAKSFEGVPVVWFDIEGNSGHPELKFWNFRSKDPAIRAGAIQRYQWVIQAWAWSNPDTKLVLYGFPTFPVWDLISGEGTASHYERAEDLKKITQHPSIIGLWPGTYWKNHDRPDHQKRAYDVVVDICKNVYELPCYFSISPGSGWSWSSQTTVRYQLNAMTKAGAAGIAIWIPAAMMNDDYNNKLKAWRNMGGSEGRYTENSTFWLESIDRYLPSAE